jgi:hypothetical protein
MGLGAISVCRMPYIIYFACNGLAFLILTMQSLFLSSRQHAPSVPPRVFVFSVTNDKTLEKSAHAVFGSQEAVRKWRLAYERND